MRVCIDGRLATMVGGTGVTTYGAALAETVQGVGYRLERLVEGRAGGRLGVWAGAVRPGEWPAPLVGDRRIVGEAFRAAQVRFDMRGSLLSLSARSDRPGLMHWTYPLPLRLREVPNIYTVHDLIPLLYPELSPLPQRRMTRLLRRIVDTATHVVTVSEASRREIIEVLGVAPDRVTNTYQAVVDVRPDNITLAHTLGNLGLVPDGYILHAGSVERRKNVQRLIQAHRESRSVLPLVIAGPDGWKSAEEMEGAGGGVIRVRWVNRPVLVSLIAGARVVIAASHAEGFGLLVAEAMALGTAVICSNRGALAEVAGMAARLVDPCDTAALATAIADLSLDDAAIHKLVAAGYRRANLFTQTAYATRLRALYEAVGHK